jgi:hypothetical protein
VDGEFAGRGEAARPFTQVFSGARRLMTQLEVDRHVWQGFGTLAVSARGGH